MEGMRQFELTPFGELLEHFYKRGALFRQPYKTPKRRKLMAKSKKKGGKKC
jgi:hypothetical protein